jgi:integrase
VSTDISSNLGLVVDSTEAISALAKEKIRMQAQRFQRGSLSILKRKSQPDAWMFRYYTEEKGRRVYKRQYVGTVVEFPKRRDAEKAVTQLRVEINEGAEYTPMNIEQVTVHYKKDELPRKAYATVVTYTDFLDSHIVPKWGGSALSAIKAIEVEKWLDGIRRKNGNPTSPATRAKIRNVMSAIFAHAIRYGWATHNPIAAVRTSTQRLKDPEFLTPAELQELLIGLPPRERVMVLLDATTGLRRGEMMALRWQDLDFENNIANITRSIYRNVIGNTKTRASRKPVPLHPILVEELKRWRSESLYRADSDFLFPSIQKNGSQPLQPDMILKRHIRPALEQMGVKKRIGWHSFRHGLSQFLRQRGIDVKIAQELLRHANSRITLDIYQQTVTEERRAAQTLAFSELWADNKGSLILSSDRTQEHPNDPQKEEVTTVNS